MEQWWDRNIIEPGKLPLLLALAAFTMTFVITRVVTRMIRAGRGPFRDVSSRGHHVHHMVPGVVLMCIGGFGGIATSSEGWGADLAAVGFGIGAGLVLDEFALIVYLQDVYWSEQGRKSVEVVVVTAALLLFLLVGFSPLGVNDVGTEEVHSRAGVLAAESGNFVLVLIALVKGKLRTALFGVLLPVVALVGAVRLARPDSLWARRIYRHRPRTRARAVRRYHRYHARWGGWERRFDELLGWAVTSGDDRPNTTDRTRRHT